MQENAHVRLSIAIGHRPDRCRVYARARRAFLGRALIAASPFRSGSADQAAISSSTARQRYQSGRECSDLFPTKSHEAQPSEAKQHHCPGRGLGYTGAYAVIIIIVPVSWDTGRQGER